MKRWLFGLAAMMLLVSVALRASELQGYVQQCENELQFDASDVQALDCNDGARFSTGLLPINDYFIYREVNGHVDLAVACRWLNSTTTRSTSAFSVEMILHNRETGGTCFFAAKPGSSGTQGVSTAIVSPTDFSNGLKKGTYKADLYWMQPTDLNNKRLPYAANAEPKDPIRCVGCHSAGPYIASPDIVPFLAQFGLLNNGHDTVADADHPPSANNLYHAVGSSAPNNPTDPNNPSAFKAWDTLVYQNLHGDNPNGYVDPQNECSTGCHSIAFNSTIHDVEPDNPFVSVRLLSSLLSDRNDISAAHLMPPTSDAYSVYRWINRDNGGGSGEYETKGDVLKQYPKLYCPNPTELQAHLVGSTDIFSTADALPNKLARFDTQHGLLCYNSQNGGQCNDWEVRYKCNGAWTDWINNDNPGGNGDYERRSDPGYANVCPAPTQMQARTQVRKIVQIGTVGFPPTPTYGLSDPITVEFNAPNDTLAEFDTNGLKCLKADQPNGQCSNYVVRFICPN